MTFDYVRSGKRFARTHHSARDGNLDSLKTGILVRLQDHGKTAGAPRSAMNLSCDRHQLSQRAIDRFAVRKHFSEIGVDAHDAGRRNKASVVLPALPSRKVRLGDIAQINALHRASHGTLVLPAWLRGAPR